MSKSKPTVIITGSSRGMGESIAYRFLRGGYRVIGIDVLPISPVLCHWSTKDYIHHHLDIRSPVKDYPDYDPEIIIANAGTGDDETCIDVNLVGTINTIEKYLNSPNLKTIIISASVSGSNACEIPTYVASKAGIIGYMKNLANRVGGRGITVNSISAGFVETEFDRAILDDRELYHQVLEQGLLKTSTSMREIEDWYWFMGTKNQTMTGQDLVIDGGESVKINFIESPEQAKKDYFFKRKIK